MKKYLQLFLSIILLALQVESISTSHTCNYTDLSVAISQINSQQLSSLIEICQKNSEYDDKAFKSQMTNLLTNQAIYTHDVAILDTFVQAGADAQAIKSCTIQDFCRII